MMPDEKWITVKILREQYDTLKVLAETPEAQKLGVADVHSGIRIGIASLIERIEHYVKVKRGDFMIKEDPMPTPPPFPPKRPRS